jgi:hypothetical protein
LRELHKPLGASRSLWEPLRSVWESWEPLGAASHKPFTSLSQTSHKPLTSLLQGSQASHKHLTRISQSLSQGSHKTLTRLKALARRALEPESPSPDGLFHELFLLAPLGTGCVFLRLVSPTDEGPRVEKKTGGAKHACIYFNRVSSPNEP